MPGKSNTVGYWIFHSIISGMLNKFLSYYFIIVNYADGGLPIDSEITGYDPVNCLCNKAI